MKQAFVFFGCMIFVCLVGVFDCRTVPDSIRSDVIVTHYPSTTNEKTIIDDRALTEEEQKPGWMRQQLMRFGRMTSRIGNTMGSHATKITAAIDKVCEVVKTVIPVIAAVCHVGQFKFCGAASGGDEITQALAPNPGDLNLDVQD